MDLDGSPAVASVSRQGCLAVQQAAASDVVTDAEQVEQPAH